METKQLKFNFEVNDSNQVNCEASLAHLANLDWNFEDAKTDFLTHSLHPYPCRFIPQIPAALIRELAGVRSGRILDPFCGGGTTLVEAVRQGHAAYGIDISPLAVLISKVKATPLNVDFDSLAFQLQQRVRQLLSDNYVPMVPEIKSLDHWFVPHVQLELAMLKGLIEEIRGEELRDFLKVALSSIMVRVSNQEGETRYAAIDKNIPVGFVYDAFFRKLSEMGAAMRRFVADLDGFVPDIETFHADTRTFSSLEDSSIDLIVTSPPYPNAYEYYLYHKYRMLWLDMDPWFVRKHEIGVRADYSKKNNFTAETFLQDMIMSFEQFSGVLKPGGFACVVIGDSTIKGQKVDNSAIIIRAANEAGFSLRSRFERNIPSSRKSFNPAIGSIRMEHLLVLQLGRKV